MRSTQIPLFTPETEWVMPDGLKDLKGYKEIAIDRETKHTQHLSLIHI